MPILLPSLVTRALEALGGVLGASDLHEYLGEADAAALEHARRVLGALRATAIQVCDDPQHEIDEARRALVRWVELKRAQERAEAHPGAERELTEVATWESSNVSERTSWTSAGATGSGSLGPSGRWRSVGMWSPC